MNIPEGWKLVPVEPTPGMLAASDIEHTARGLVSIALISYRAMLDAAPTPPAQPVSNADELERLRAELAARWRFYRDHGSDMIEGQTLHAWIEAHKLRLGGRDEYMAELTDIRQYAGTRANIAFATLDSKP